jgi:hypothetical protein
MVVKIYFLELFPEVIIHFELLQILLLLQLRKSLELLLAHEVLLHG